MRHELGFHFKFGLQGEFSEYLIRNRLFGNLVLSSSTKKKRATSELAFQLSHHQRSDLRNGKLRVGLDIRSNYWKGLLNEHVKYGRSFRSKIRARHSLRRPRFPTRQMHFHYRVTFTRYIWHFVQPRRMTLWPCDLDLLTPTFVSCTVASHARLAYKFWLSYGYRLLELWITEFEHIYVSGYSRYACAVSRDLSPGGQNWPTFLKSVTPIYLFTLWLLGLYAED